MLNDYAVDVEAVAAVVAAVAVAVSTLGRDRVLSLLHYLRTMSV